ncbi:LOW QUALITY PROTEIN: uncharacterized protein WM294_014333 [Sarcoramphus papa]
MACFIMPSELHLLLSPSADESSLSHTEPLETGLAEDDSVKSKTCAVALDSWTLPACEMSSLTTLTSFASEMLGHLILSRKRCLHWGMSMIKASPAPRSLIHFSCLLLLGSQVHLRHPDMSCYSQCQPCQPCGPTPLANSCNETCVRQCQNSTVVIEPSPVVVTLPGPILSSFPQNTVVGSSTSAAVGSILSCEGVPITSGCCDLSCITSRYCGSRCRPC